MRQTVTSAAAATVTPDFEELWSQLGVGKKILNRSLHEYIDDERLGNVFLEVIKMNYAMEMLFTNIVLDVRKALGRRKGVDHYFWNVVADVFSSYNVSETEGKLFHSLLKDLFLMSSGN